MLPTTTLQAWDYEALKAWVDNINIAECDWFDFKELYENFPADHLRKAFASLTNTHGGYLFFGIKDSTKEINGCQYTGDFHRFISDKLHPDKIDPVPQWDLIKTISIPENSKLVHIVKIEKASRFQKPSVCDGNIYIRVPGRAQQITRLSQLRDNFFEPTDMILLDIDQLQTLVDQARNHNYNWMLLDGLTLAYLMKLRGQVISSIESAKQINEDPSQWEDALEQLKRGIGLIEQINQMSSRSASATHGIDINQDDSTLQNIVKDASTSLEEFAVRIKGLVTEDL